MCGFEQQVSSFTGLQLVCDKIEPALLKVWSSPLQTKILRTTSWILKALEHLKLLGQHPYGVVDFDILQSPG